MDSNREFAKTNTEFRAACMKVKDLKPSTRQASRWRRRKGIAWKVRNEKQLTI